MREGVHNSARLAWVFVAGALVQHYFHGWELGAWSTPIAAALVITSVVLVLTWAPVSRRLAAMSPYTIVRNDTRVRACAAASTAPPSARTRESGAARGAAANHDRIVRSNVQSVIDEMAWATRLINEAIEDHGGFWTQPIHWTTWEAVRDTLASERGFHVAYEATRSAWDALQRAELSRLNHEPREGIRPWEERHITMALERAALAQQALLAFLGVRASGVDPA